jgi:phenylpyruvate tautomerase PptA (4-oxalocrotonate tautomerase family)
MPIVKVNVCYMVDQSVREKIIPAIQTAIVENLGATYEHAFVFIFDTSEEKAQINGQLNNKCILVETCMFSGRTDEIKEKYFGALSKIINEYLDTEGKAVFFCIIDPDKNNWADINGIPYSKIQ